MNKIQQWADELSFIEDQDRLMYLIDLAKEKTSLPSELRTDDRLVNGCMSKIWVEVGKVEDKVKVYYDSDAMITKGITRVVCDCFDDVPVDEAKSIQKDDFEALGIRELLTAGRRNGLGSLIETIRAKVHSL